MAIPIIKMATIGLLPSPLKKLYYRLTGAKIGKGVSIGILSIINSKEIEIGDNTKIGPITFISVDKLKLGKRVKINMLAAIETGILEVDDDSTIMEQVVIGGMLTPRSKLIIGKRVKIFPYSFINPTEPITIGDDAGIGGANYIFTHGSWQSVLDGFPVSFGPVTIEKGVWFPWRVFVMPNVTVGEYATIGAGSVITKNIPSRSLAAGSPAKVLRTGDEYIKTLTLEEKNRIVVDILKEFVEFMNYKGTLCTKTSAETDSFVSLNINKNGKDYKLYYNTTIETMPDANVIISLTTINQTLTSEFIKQNKVWFDIGAKRSFFNKNEVWTDVKDFFSRWGIRFNIES